MISQIRVKSSFEYLKVNEGKRVIAVTLVVVWILVPDGLVGVFQKRPISWDFQQKQTKKPIW